MNKISCDVCMDLMPLVKDGVASEDSKDLVQIHVKDCGNCMEIYQSLSDNAVQMNAGNDAKVMSKVRKQLFWFAFVIMVGGTLLGTVLTNGMGVFYNTLIMPIVGAIAYFVMRKKVYYGMIGLFFLSGGWNVFTMIIEGELQYSNWIEVIRVSFIFWPCIYILLYSIGIAIGALLKYAFLGEK